MNNKTFTETRLMTAKQLSTYLSFPLSTIYLMVEKREIPFKRFGRKSIRFDRKEIDQWIDRHYDKSYYLG
ncbi:MAG: helix-turn-helix domain-containing protein [Calditrichaeota bacterium]|nr:MAG: helix-turn-helix domain-containing protein [Calditrichota bacterium]